MTGSQALSRQHKREAARQLIVFLLGKLMDKRSIWDRIDSRLLKESIKKIEGGFEQKKMRYQTITKNKELGPHDTHDEEAD